MSFALVPISCGFLDAGVKREQPHDVVDRALEILGKIVPFVFDL